MLKNSFAHSHKKFLFCYRLLKTSKATLNNLRDYWILLPRRLCDRGLAASDNETVCWNGHNTSGYVYLMEEKPCCS